MKKSKVIIPAMALLLFSTAASITGTVAWFTATRLVTVTTGEFAVNNVDDGLTAAMSAGVATVASDTNSDGVNDKVSLVENHKLTHGSFNFARDEQKAWILNKDAYDDSEYHVAKGTLTNAESGYTSNAHQAATDIWYHKTVTDNGTSTYYYVAVSFTITFTYTFGTQTKDVGVYLNPQASTLTIGNDTAGTDRTKKTGLGFRLAFIPSDTDVAPKVFGNNPAAANTLFYTTSAPKDGTTAYTTGDNYSGNYVSPVTSGYTGVADATSDDDTTRLARKDRICTLTKVTNATKGTSQSATVKCVAWFEGEDPNVVSTADMDHVTASLTFFARDDYGTTTA